MIGEHLSIGNNIEFAFGRAAFCRKLPILGCVCVCFGLFVENLSFHAVFLLSTHAQTVSHTELRRKVMVQWKYIQAVSSIIDGLR